MGLKRNTRDTVLLVGDSQGRRCCRRWVQPKACGERGFCGEPGESARSGQCQGVQGAFRAVQCQSPVCCLSLCIHAVATAAQTPAPPWPQPFRQVPHIKVVRVGQEETVLAEQPDLAQSRHN